MSQVDHQARVCPAFCGMKRLGMFLLPLEWDAGPLLGYMYPQALNLPVPICTPGWRGTARVKCLHQEPNTVSPARVKPLLLDLESSMLTMRPPDAVTSCYISYLIYLLLSNRIHIFWKLIAQLQLQISSLPRMLPSCALWSIYHLHNNTAPLTFKKLKDQKLRSGWLRAYNII